jgi:sugar lactone lactonase YvrE
MDRYISSLGLAVANSWRARHVTPPSQMFGANGIRLGPDGQLYVAEAFGGRVSAIDLDTKTVRTVCEVGGPIVAPDDIAFDTQGHMYVPDVMIARVCVRAPNGVVSVLAGDLPCANGITVHQDRIFMDECRPNGRLMELFKNGDAPRPVAQDLPCPNAFSVGPDGYHYFPVLTANEIWRVAIAGGRPEKFAGDLGVPLAVKFNSKGELISVQGRTGEVLSFNLRSGARTLIAKLRPGLDNLEVTADDRLFVSHYNDGSVTEILANGEACPLTRPGFLGPYGLAFAEDGLLYAADGIALSSVDADGTCSVVGHRMDGKLPGWVRGLARGANGTLVVTTAEGVVATYHPQTHETIVHQRGLHELYGVVRRPDGAVVVAEGAEGRLLEVSELETSVLARGLARPTGVAAGADGALYVCEADRGRVVCIVGNRVATLVEGLAEPHGVAIANGALFVVDVGSRKLIAHTLATGETETIASYLPVGSPPGTRAHLQPGIPERIPGPLSPFSGIAIGDDGVIYVAGNGDGSVLAICRS